VIAVVGNEMSTELFLLAAAVGAQDFYGGGQIMGLRTLFPTGFRGGAKADDIFSNNAISTSSTETLDNIY